MESSTPLHHTLEKSFLEARRDDEKCLRCREFDIDAAIALPEGKTIRHVLGSIDQVRNNTRCPICRFALPNGDRVFVNEEDGDYRLSSVHGERLCPGCGFDIGEPECLDKSTSMTSREPKVKMDCPVCNYNRNNGLGAPQFRNRWTSQLIDKEMNLAILFVGKSNGHSSIIKSWGFVGAEDLNYRVRTIETNRQNLDDEYGRFVHPRHVDYDLVKYWLSRCELEHDFCQITKNASPTAGKDSSALPDDFFGLNLIDIDRKRLVKPLSTVPYITLSYTWGPGPHDYLGMARVGNEERVSSHIDGGDVEMLVLEDQPLHLVDETLPRTLRDAIEFTRSIGQRFLWIDALCIPQADPVAKARQISLMDRIYNESHCTLIAACGSDVHAGLWGSSLSSPRRFIQNAECLTTNPKAIYFDYNRIEGKQRLSSWHSRAWTLQEGVLARRRLFFSWSEVVFVCNEAAEQESVGSRSFKNWDHGWKQESWQIGPSLNHHDWHFSRSYAVFVQDYSNREMGNAEDALNAFKGLTRSSSVAHGFPFFFGLPARSFGRALLWEDFDVTPPRWPTKKPAWGQEGSWPHWTWIGRWRRTVYDKLYLEDSEGRGTYELDRTIDEIPPARFEAVFADTGSTVPLAHLPVGNHEPPHARLRIHAMAVRISLPQWTRQETQHSYTPPNGPVSHKIQFFKTTASDHGEGEFTPDHPVTQADAIGPDDEVFLVAVSNIAAPPRDFTEPPFLYLLVFVRRGSGDIKQTSRVGFGSMFIHRFVEEAEGVLGFDMAHESFLRGALA